MSDKSTSDLLHLIYRAHGGLEKWTQVKSITARAQVRGWALRLKWQAGAFSNTEVKIFPEQAYAQYSPFPRKGQQGVFYRDKVWIEDIKGETLCERLEPRSYFNKFRRKIWWDSLDILYFGSYAMWNYLTLPFGLANPDLEKREIEAWQEKGETWRRLQVKYPADFPTHCQEQIFYFDERGYLRRHDYTAEPIGPWAKASHYSWDHREFGGLIFPIRRSVWPRLGNNKPLRSIVLIDIKIESIEVEFGA